MTNFLIRIIGSYDWLAIIVLREAVESDGADLFCRVKHWRLGRLLIVPSVLQRRSLTQLIAFVERSDHDFGRVEGGRTTDGTPASLAAVFAASRVAVLLDDLHFLVVGADIDRRVRQVHQAWLLILARLPRSIRSTILVGLLLCLLVDRQAVGVHSNALFPSRLSTLATSLPLSGPRLSVGRCQYLLVDCLLGGGILWYRRGHLLLWCLRLCGLAHEVGALLLLVVRVLLLYLERLVLLKLRRGRLGRGEHVVLLLLGWRLWRLCVDDFGHCGLDGILGAI